MVSASPQPWPSTRPSAIRRLLRQHLRLTLPADWIEFVTHPQTPSDGRDQLHYGWGLAVTATSLANDVSRRSSPIFAHTTAILTTLYRLPAEEVSDAADEAMAAHEEAVERITRYVPHALHGARPTLDSTEHVYTDGQEYLRSATTITIRHPYTAPGLPREPAV